MMIHRADDFNTLLSTAWQKDLYRLQIGIYWWSWLFLLTIKKKFWKCGKEVYWWLLCSKVVPFDLRRFLIYSYLIYTKHISGTSLYCQKIDKLTLIAVPPFYQVTCNNNLTVFKLGRTTSTWLWVGGLNNYLNTCIFHQLFLWDIK